MLHLEYYLKITETHLGPCQASKKAPSNILHKVLNMSLTVIVESRMYPQR